MTSGRIPVSLESRFWPKVSVASDDECWEWLGAKTKGYGNIWDLAKRSYSRAHRVAYELLVGPIPDGLLVLHECDNPGCVNPRHLWLGTCADNMTDKTRKGRNGRCGTRSPLRGDANPGSAYQRWLRRKNREETA